MYVDYFFYIILLYSGNQFQLASHSSISPFLYLIFSNHVEQVITHAFYLIKSFHEFPSHQTYLNHFNNWKKLARKRTERLIRKIVCTIIVNILYLIFPTYTILSHVLILKTEMFNKVCLSVAFKLCYMVFCYFIAWLFDSCANKMPFICFTSFIVK